MLISAFQLIMDKSIFVTSLPPPLFERREGEKGGELNITN